MTPPEPRMNVKLGFVSNCLPLPFGCDESYSQPVYATVIRLPAAAVAPVPTVRSVCENGALDVGDVVLDEHPEHPVATVRNAAPRMKEMERMRNANVMTVPPTVYRAVATTTPKMIG